MALKDVAQLTLRILRVVAQRVHTACMYTAHMLVLVSAHKLWMHGMLLPRAESGLSQALPTPVVRFLDTTMRNTT